MTTEEAGAVTGTKDKDYDLIWYVEACLSNALRLETYIHDAARDGDSELAGLFRKAQGGQPQGRGDGQADAAFAAGLLTGCDHHTTHTWRQRTG